LALVERGRLKARRYGGWLLEVQPALVPGVTTSTGAPKASPPPAKKATKGKTRARVGRGRG
jgi:hypothetical protein